MIIKSTRRRKFAAFVACMAFVFMCAQAMSQATSTTGNAAKSADAAKIQTVNTIRLLEDMTRGMKYILVFNPCKYPEPPPYCDGKK